MREIGRGESISQAILMRWVLGALFLALLRTSNGAGSAEDAERVLKCFKNVSERYLTDKMVLLLIQNGTRGPDWIDGIIKYVVGSGKWSVHISDENYKPPNFFYFHIRLERQRARNIIILLREETTYDKLAGLLKNMLWFSSARIMIIIKSEGEGEEILRNLWKTKKALNTVVMAIGAESIRFSTVYPFPDPDKIVMLDAWNNGFRHEANLYPNKIPSDFKGHLMKMGLRFAEPYVLKPSAPGRYDDGVDIRIVKALQSNLNFAFEFVESPPGENPIFATLNGTPHGLFRLLNKGVADVIFLGMRGRFDRNALSEALTPHIYDKSIWIVPFSESDRGGFYHVFEAPVWGAVAVAAVVLTCFSIALDYSNSSKVPARAFRLSDHILRMLSKQLNYPTTVKSKRTRVKIFTVLMYFYALIITSAYNSSLVQTFTSYDSKVFFDSPEEASDGGLVAILFPSAKPTYNQTQHELWNKILRPSKHVYSDDYIETLTIISENKTAFTLLLDNIAKYEIAQRKDRRKQMVHAIDKTYGTYPVNFFMSRGHPLAGLFDRKIQNLVEGGIVELWLKQFLSGYRKMRKREVSFKDEEPLKLMHFHFILYFVGAAWAGAGIVFVFEVAVGKIKARKKRGARYRNPGPNIRRRFR